LEELIGSSISQSRLKGRQVKVNCSPKVDLVSVDGTLISQVFQNLIDNFISYTAETSELWISVVQAQKTITIQFSDNGPGIKPGDEEKIFEKLYRPSGTTEGGFGLGLAICRAIMKLHGGEIFARNNADGGISIFVVFPRTKQPSMEEELEE